jgi:antitoxin FitA
MSDSNDPSSPACSQRKDTQLLVDIFACIEYIACMTQITIRNLDEAVRIKLKTRAASKGRSLEAELRDIITQAAAETKTPRDIGQSVRDRVKRLGGFDIDIPPRSKSRPLPDFK